MERDTVVVGRVVAPWGVRGEVKVEVMTDFPDRFTGKEEVYVGGTLMTIEGCKWSKGMAIVKLDRIGSVEAAEGFRGQFLEIPRAQVRALSEDEYYQYQIVGLEVWTSGGDFIGRVSGVLPTGSNDVYVVSSADGEILVPAIEDVVRLVDLERGRMEIEPMEGLLRE